jgi:hypothetical protein
MTLDEKRVKDFSVPGVGVVFGGGIGAVHVILLDVGPLRYDAAAEKVAPPNEGLVGCELDLFHGIILKFNQWKRGCIKVGAESGEKDVDELWVGVAGFSACAG